MCDHRTYRDAAELVECHTAGTRDARHGPTDGFREWLPQGWESSYYPAEDDALILPCWFRWAYETIRCVGEECRVDSWSDATTLNAVRELGAMLVRDGGRLIQYLIDTRGYRQMPRSVPTVKAVDDLPEVADYLQAAQAWAEAENKRPRMQLPQKKIAPQFALLWTWAEENLVGIQQRVVKLVIEHDGEYPLLDIALDSKVDWAGYGEEDEKAKVSDRYNSLRQAVKPKLLKEGWELRRRKNIVWLKKVGQT